MWARLIPTRCVLPLGESERFQIERQSLGRLHSEQGAAGVIPTNYNQKCHIQEQDLGGAFSTLFANGLVILCQSPMCQFSSDGGHATDWHLVHLGVCAIQCSRLYQFLS